MAVVAEGVETEDQLGCLTPMGYDLVQGFYFDRPKPVAAMSARYPAPSLAATA